MQPRSIDLQTSVGDLRRLSLTLPQAAQVLNVDVTGLRKAVDRRVVTATLVSQGKRQVRRLDGIDILCLRMGRVLNNSICQDLYARLKQASDRANLDEVLESPNGGERRSDVHQIAGLLRDAAIETVSDIQSFEDASASIDEKGRINGANVEAHRIAALRAGGMTDDEILLDYPNLDSASIEAALVYAKAHPKQGRPYPASTVKSVSRSGSGGGVAAAFAASADESDA